MIIVDWGNYEETLIVLRIIDTGEYRDFRVASVQIHQLLSSASINIDLMIDMRFSNTVSARMVRLLNREIEHRQPNLRHIIVITAPAQTRMLTLASAFYPTISRDIHNSTSSAAQRRVLRNRRLPHTRPQ